MPLGVHSVTGRSLRKRRQILPQATSGNENGDGNKRNKTAHVDDGAETAIVINDDRWVPENVLFDEFDIVKRNESSVKSMKVARNKLARRLAQKRFYFDRELSTKAKPPQPFQTLDIKSFYYISRHGPIVQKSISLHAWCRREKRTGVTTPKEDTV